MDRDNFVIRLILRARDEGFQRASQLVDRSMTQMRRSVNAAQNSMRQFDNQTDRTKRGLDNLNRSARDTQRSINAIRGPTDGAARSTRNWGLQIQRVNDRLIQLRRRVDDNRESIARFDNEIRGMRVLVIAAQMQALTSAVLALGGALTAVAGSAVTAGAALGGALAAGAAQAIPAIGLLAATMVRLKSVFDVVQQVQDAQKATATQATSATNKQADSMDKLKNAADGVRDAQQRVREAHLGVAEATREARREQEDLIQAQRRARLQEGESEERLRLLRAQGVTGFELRGAQLDADESRTGARRANQDLNRFRTQGPEGVRNAVRQLNEAEEALTRARRSNSNARRDIADTAQGTVAAARQLDFMQAQLTGAERRLVRSILNLRDTWRRVSGPITDTIVDSFTLGVDRAERVIQRPSLIRAFQRLADQTGRQMDRATRFLTSNRTIGFFERQTRELGRNLQPATTAAIRLSRAFMNIADAAAPTLRRLIRDFSEFTGDVERVTRNQGGMRELFEFGEMQLHAWLDLASAIGQTIKAIIAPGGDLDRGAGASGLRILRDLTREFRDAAEWINGHPMETDEFFKDSEESFRRILDLLIEIGQAMFRIFDPDAIDAFADIVEALIPAFEQIAETFGFISRIFADLLGNPVFRLVIQTGFGLLVFQRIGTKFLGLFSSIGAAALGVVNSLINWNTFMGRAGTTLAAMVASTGGLTARIQAATAAWRGYGTAAQTAQIQAGAGFVAGGGRRGAAPGAAPGAGNVFAGTPGRGTPAPGGNVFAGAPIFDPRSNRYVDPVTGRFVSGRGTPIQQPGRLARGVSNARGILAGIGGALGSLGGLAASVVIGTIAISAINNYNRVPSDSTLSPRQQRLAGRARGPLESALGAQPGSIREAIQPGFFETAFGVFNDSGKAQKIADRLFNVENRVRKLFKLGDERGLARLAGQIRNFGEDLGGTRGKILEDFADNIDKLSSRLREFGVNARNVSNRPLFKQALEQIRELRVNGIKNIEDLRDQMRINFTFINEAAEKGSNAWRVAMVQNTQAGVSGLLDAAKDGRIKWRDAMEEITRITRRQMRLVRGHVRDLSGEARDALSENFRTARVRAERQLGRLEDATGKSLDFLKRLMGNELASYGFTSTEVRRIIKQKQDPDDFSRGSRQTEGTSSGPFRTDQTPAIGGFGDRFMRRPMGGFIGAMGERGQDAIRTILGRGEAVLNWGQQRFVEPALNAAYGFGLDELFRKTKGYHGGGMGQGQTGYAAGGRIPIVPVPGFPGERANRAILDEIAFVTKRFGLRLTDAYGPGHQSPGHTIYGTAADFAGPDRSMNAAVKFLARRYKVLYDGRFGSMAYAGHGPSTVAGANAHLHVEFGTKDLGAATGNQKPFSIPRVAITGAGPMSEIASAGIAQVRRGAIRKARAAIERALGAGTEGAEFGAGAAPPGQLRSWLRRALSITNHLTPGNLSALYGRAMQESGGDPRAINNWDSNAAAGNNSRGLLQTIPSTFAAYSLPGMKDIYNPIHNAVAAIRYMYATYGHIVGPSSTGYDAGGELPGPLGSAKMILAHGKEWILNEGQKSKIAGWLGTSIPNLRDRLGFTGGPTSAQGGGDTAKFDPIFDQQEFLGNRLQPLSFGGLARMIRAFFKHMQELNKKGKDSIDNVNENLDIITRQDGLLDQLDLAIERAVENMRNRVNFVLFGRGRTVTRGNRGPAFEARAELNQLIAEGRFLRREDRFIGRALGGVTGRIRRIRRGGVDEDEEADLESLLTQQRNLRERRRGVRGRRGENLRARFEAQQQVIEATLDRDLRGSEIGLQGLSFRQRIATAFGRGGQAGFINEQIALMESQRGPIQAALDKAKAQGNRELEDQLNERLGELDTSIQELVAQRLSTQIDEVNARAGRAQTFLGLRERMLAALGAVGLASGRGQIFAERGSILSGQRDELIALRDQAIREGNTGAVESLTEQIETLGVEIAENTQALFQARIEDVNRVQSTASSLSGTRSRIIELQRDLGMITPQQAQQMLIEQNTIQRNALIAQQAGLQQLLNEATAASDTAAIDSLTQQLADNELAQLENTSTLKELNGALNETQSFSSTAWQWYRTAIFNGSGGLLESFTPPIGLTGVPMPTGTWGAGGGGESSYTGGTVAITNNITQNETVDYTALSNKIAWDINTPGV